MTAIEKAPAQNLALAQPGEFSRDQIELIKRTVAVNTTDDELKLFLEVCRGTGLNPFQRQIYAIKRRSGREEKMTIQTGIDGYRLIAARTGVHLGTTDAEFGVLNADGFPEWARVVVRKLVQGHTVEFPATARWSEYVQTKDEWAGGQRTGKKTVSDMWSRMPHTMLGKCAEALALRKAFPAELSGVYTNEEMAQADNVSAPPQQETQARSARPADVTREVRQAAGLPERRQVAEDPAHTAAKKRISDMAERVRGISGVHATEVQQILDQYDWEADYQACAPAYKALTEFGKERSPKPALQAATPPIAATPAPQQIDQTAHIAQCLSKAPYEFTQAQQPDMLAFIGWLVDRAAPLAALSDLTQAEQSKAVAVLDSPKVDGAGLLERWNISRNPPPAAPAQAAPPPRRNRIGDEPAIDAEFNELPSVPDDEDLSN